jgi:uncharacterized membrane protein YfcA
VLIGFGATSAIGGLVGATLQAVVQGPVLAKIFGLLLVFAGLGSLTGFAQRMRFAARGAALIGGAVSGVARRSCRKSGRGPRGGASRVRRREGSVRGDGNRGHAHRRRSARTGVSGDPGAVLAPHWPIVLVVSGAIVGTLHGGWMLRRKGEAVFRRVVGALLLVLGAGTVARAG